MAEDMDLEIEPLGNRGLLVGLPGLPAVHTQEAAEQQQQPVDILPTTTASAVTLSKDSMACTVASQLSLVCSYYMPHSEHKNSSKQGLTSWCLGKARPRKLPPIIKTLGAQDTLN